MKKRLPTATWSKERKPTRRVDYCERGMRSNNDEHSCIAFIEQRRFGNYIHALAEAQNMKIRV